MFFGAGLVAVALLALWIYCIFDVILTDEDLIRNLPKYVWLFLVIILPSVGSIAWLILGRPTNRAGWQPGETRTRPRPLTSRGVPAALGRPVAPDDDPAFLAGIDNSRAERLAEWEADLKRREDELRRREDSSEQ